MTTSRVQFPAPDFRLRRAAVWFFCCAGFAALPAAEPAPATARPRVPKYTVTDLGPKLHVTALNSRGEVVGTLHREEGKYAAFLYSQGQLRELGTLGGPSSSARAINDAGHIVGSASTARRKSERVFEQHGFLYVDGVMRSLGPLDDKPENPGFTDAHAINSAGVIVGQTTGMKAWFYANGKRHPLGTLVPAGTETFLGESVNSDGTRTPLTTRAEGYVNPKHINAAGAIVGQAKTPDGKSHAFLYLPATDRLHDLGTLGGDSSSANAINDAGLIVGSAKTTDGKGHAFLYREGRMHDLGVPGGYETSIAQCINRPGTIVGHASRVTGGGFLWIGIDSRAYRYADGQWTDLNTLVDLTGTGLKRLDSAEAINDSGQIIGRASGNGTYHGYLLSPIPPP